MRFPWLPGDEFVNAILENRKPLVDIITALNTTVAGVVAHQSALKNGELMKIPNTAYNKNPIRRMI